jgi:hypothetical protein
MTPAAMTDHVVEICARHNITIHWLDGYRAKALIEVLEIFIPRIRSPRTYATALHEIGHCLGRYPMTKSVLTSERWAWRWARDNALIWTPSMERSMRQSLDWYEARRWPVRVVLGPPGCHCE